MYRAAADRGHHGAQYQYAFILDRAGRGGWDSAVQVFSYFKLSAEQGFTAAQLNVGDAYEHGKGVEADLEEAVRWYQLAALKGNEGPARRAREVLDRLAQSTLARLVVDDDVVDAVRRQHMSVSDARAFAAALDDDETE